MVKSTKLLLNNLLLRRIAYVKRLGTDEKLEFMKTQMIAADMMRRGYQASKKDQT